MDLKRWKQIDLKRCLPSGDITVSFPESEVSLEYFSSHMLHTSSKLQFTFDKYFVAFKLIHVMFTRDKLGFGRSNTKQVSDLLNESWSMFEHLQLLMLNVMITVMSFS